MDKGEAQQPVRETDKGPSERLLDQAKRESGQLVPGTELPGAQNPSSVEIKDETNPNTE